MSALPIVPTIDGTPTDLSTMDYIDAYRHDTAFMHNALIRAFNQIGAKAMKVLPVEMADFASYVDAFCETLRRHCEGENKIIFPRLSAHTSLNSEDNLAVLGCLRRIEQWVREAMRLPEKADPTELITAMEVMAPVFNKNMHEQLNHMSPSALQSALSGPELRNLVNDDIAWIAQNSRMEYFLPFLVLHHDRSTNETWPGLPSEAKNVLPELVTANSEQPPKTQPTMPKTNAVYHSESAGNGQFPAVAPGQAQARANPLLRTLSSQAPVDQQGAPNNGPNQQPADNGAAQGAGANAPGQN